MIPDLPPYVNIVFILTALVTLWFLWKASSSVVAVIVAAIWLVLQGILSYKGFYLDSLTRPPRLALAVFPPLVLIILLLTTPAGKRFTQGLNLKTLLLLNIVRIPVEICLYWLFLHKAVPELITFAGSNLDMISGISAPMIYFVCFRRRSFRSKNLFLAWNIIGLVLLVSVVANAFLSAPTIFQKLSFEQPNVAILYFPFVWLPCFIVMVILFGHLVMIKRLLAK
jgi:hypothetical protein